MGLISPQISLTASPHFWRTWIPDPPPGFRIPASRDPEPPPPTFGDDFRGPGVRNPGAGSGSGGPGLGIRTGKSGPRIPGGHVTRDSTPPSPIFGVRKVGPGSRISGSGRGPDRYPGSWVREKIRGKVGRFQEYLEFQLISTGIRQ